MSITTTTEHPLESRALTLGYEQKVIIEALSLKIPRAKVTVFVGSNGCGKSTLLKSFARVLKPQQGCVLLDGQEIQRSPTRQVAQKLSMLPQGPLAPEGLTVHQLVRQGRYPHQGLLRQWSQEDERLVEKALHDTGLSALQHQPVDSLSGGQRQRAWIAMTLAQNTKILLLDEPTTYLDLTHQIEILDLLRDLNDREQKTIVMVLHDLNLACRYADHIVAIQHRNVYAQGSPEEIITEATVSAVFDLGCRIIRDPLFGSPLCIPFGKTTRMPRQNQDQACAIRGEACV
ncbi:ABC transporter ATP-binding protein [Hahella aquimaris]|uniref:ABC transporter ATP-binding protein n=1 Tax=Hahella sp. HNIBRBA332 TaxID=3015983 RepID=UPI00273AF97D|nr:ABC transporter ATP-binding protein [Hahella sp. HNIBRBA332]WLQ16399.1 ABC transporter ATP-binding protein [Hahella sp. HNIBRBA332]